MKKIRLKPLHKKLLMVAAALLVVGGIVAIVLALRSTPERTATLFMEQLVAGDITGAHAMLNEKAMNTSLEAHFGEKIRVQQFQWQETERSENTTTLLYRTLATPGEERDVAVTLVPDPAGKWIITDLQVTPLIPEASRTLGATYATLLCKNELPRSRELVAHLDTQEVANVERLFLDSAGPWKWTLLAAEPLGRLPPANGWKSKLHYDVTGGFVPFRFAIEIGYFDENSAAKVSGARITGLMVEPRPAETP